MCDMRYFKLARHKLDVAKLAMEQQKTDELFITDVEYYLQQCVEFTLKAFLECKGVTVPETHQISKLIRMTADNGSACVVSEWIKSHAIELTEWESQSRYNFDYYVELSLLKEGIVEIEQFLIQNGLSDVLASEISADVKEKIKKIVSKNTTIESDFEWNCYYQIFKNRL